MDESTREYLQWESDLCDLLAEHGWIESIESNRNDTNITWTRKGRQCGERFIEEVCALPRDRPWTEDELDNLRSFGRYMGLIKKTRRDRTRELTSSFIERRDLLVVTTSPSESRRYRLFSAQTFDDFYDYIESEHDAESEVMLISIDQILESNVDRHFPFASERSSSLPEDRDLLVITTLSSKSQCYRLFSDQTFDAFQGYIESEHDTGSEVMTISIDRILDSNVGKAFPFGAADSPGAIWKRGKQSPTGWRRWLSGWL